MEQIYRKNNFESKILKNITIEREGYDPIFLKDQSNKYIWVTCRYCGEPNKVRKSKYYISGNSNAHIECRKKELSEIDCSWTRDDVKEKIKKTYLKQHGVDHNSKIKLVVKKRKETFLKKYGVDNPSKFQEVKSKKKNTMLKKYGVEFPLQSPEILSKSQETLKENYNTNVPAKSEVITNKMQETSLKKYGFPNPMENNNIKEKSKIGFQDYVKEDPDGRFSLLNSLRDEKNPIWADLKKISLNKIAEKNNIEYKKLRSCFYDNSDLYEKFKKIYCFPKIQTQKEIANLIESLGSGLNVVLNDRKVLNGTEIDIYIPEKKIGIEYNGCFWHSEAWLDKKEAQYKHHNKTKICEENGIKLIHIFETEWENNKDLILLYIKNALGLNSRKFYARKCQVNNNRCPEFFDGNHLQKRKNGVEVYFNLEYNGEIVASMTASKHHERNNRENNFIILSRFCSLVDCNVVGGASKLFKQFTEWAKEKGYKKIISWSDSAISNGDIYNILGFQLEKENKSDFRWWDTNINEMVTKQSRRHIGKAKPVDWKRDEWYAHHGLYRIWNCGRKTWVYSLE